MSSRLGPRARFAVVGTVGSLLLIGGTPIPGAAQHPFVGGAGAFFASVEDTSSAVAVSFEVGVSVTRNYQAVLRGTWWSFEDHRLALGVYYGGRLPMNRHLYGDAGVSVLRTHVNSVDDYRAAIGFGLGWILDVSATNQLRLQMTYLRDSAEQTYGIGALLSFGHGK